MKDDNVELRIWKLAGFLKTTPHVLRLAMLMWLHEHDALSQEQLQTHLEAVRLVHELDKCIMRTEGWNIPIMMSVYRKNAAGDKQGTHGGSD